MVFMLRPRSGPNQWVARERYNLVPATEVVEFTDLFGNSCQRLVAPPGEFALGTEVEVMLTAAATAADAPFVAVPDLPDATLMFLLPSRYCESDRFWEMATDIVAQAAPGHGQVDAITRWVNTNVINTPTSGPGPVSAIEINGRREGVCRDLAHISIALCRSLCIPARLVVGYLEGLVPMDIHAWFEAYVGGEWQTYDPAAFGNSGARIRIACGRDAADVAIYNQYGPALYPREMKVSMTAIT